MNCDICESPMVRGLCGWHFRCPRCGLEHSTLQPAIEGANPMDEGLRAQALGELRQSNFRRLLSFMNHQLPNSRVERPRLLEVGCAHGWFLAQAKNHYDVLGIEPDPAIFEVAAATGCEVRKGFFPDALQPYDMFELIVFNDVLEHLPDIASVFERCTEHLTKNGFLIINAPNSTGFFYRLAKLLVRVGKPASFERLWQVGLPSPHLYYLSDRAVAGLATRSGYVVQARTSLPALSSSNIAARIEYAGDVGPLKARMMELAITLALPLIRLAPPDIRVWALQKT